jgi:hypothetical protein
MPSTFVALRIAWAPISTARSAAVVSVVKYGLPVPARLCALRQTLDGSARRHVAGCPAGRRAVSKTA